MTPLPRGVVLRQLAILSLVLTATAGGHLQTTERPSVPHLLDRYLSGDFETVLRSLEQTTGLEDILKQLRRDGPQWIEAGDPSKRGTRELVAATLALEAARAGAWHEWKLIQRQPRMCSDCRPPLNVLYWKAPPLLIEWGCELLRRNESPSPIERWWQLAALSVAQRSEDTQFLVGDPNIGLGPEAGEIGNIQDEIKHLEHIMPRFPQEMRFMLAQGIARDRVWPDDAVQAYRALENHPDVGGEAMMRVGVMQSGIAGGFNYRRPGDPESRFRPSPADALKSFDRAELLTRDPYVVYLARYFKGRLFERQRRLEQAEAAYRGAVAATPHAQSGTIALGSLVFRRGQRIEAQRLIQDMLVQDPPVRDPWRAYVHADDRFWPHLVAKLRAEVVK